jgi:hypothetical protein
MTKKKIKAPPEHQAFCGKRMRIDVTTLSIFPKEEIDFLEQYGIWLTALANGDIEPFTKKQTEFVEVCRGERKPFEMWEKAWSKFQARRKYDSENKDAPQYEWIAHGTWAGSSGWHSSLKR